MSTPTPCDLEQNLALLEVCTGGAPLGGGRDLGLDSESPGSLGSPSCRHILSHRTVTQECGPNGAHSLSHSSNPAETGSLVKTNTTGDQQGKGTK